jgi:hypothetical protein
MIRRAPCSICGEADAGGFPPSSPELSRTRRIPACTSVGDSGGIFGCGDSPGDLDSGEMALLDGDPPLRELVDVGSAGGRGGGPGRRP